jgi:hypothetical protein
MERFTAAINRQADAILTLSDATRSQHASPAPPSDDAQQGGKPFVLSERGREILDELDHDR